LWCRCAVWMWDMGANSRSLFDGGDDGVIDELVEGAAVALVDRPVQHCPRTCNRRLSSRKLHDDRVGACQFEVGERFSAPALRRIYHMGVSPRIRQENITARMEQHTRAHRRRGQRMSHQSGGRSRAAAAPRAPRSPPTQSGNHHSHPTRTHTRRAFRS